MSFSLEKLDKYLAATGNRDKVMAIAQFLPLMLYGPAKDAGCEGLSKSLKSLSAMADSYRAITRLGLLAGALSKSTLKQLCTPHGDALLDHAGKISHGFHVLYCLFENSAVLASHGVYPSKLTRLGGCAVACWFYVLVLGVASTLYKLVRSPLADAQKKSAQVTLLKLSCFLVFSLSCLPPGGPKLFDSSACACAPLHNLLSAISPRHVPMPDTVRGALGLVASICDFY